METQYLKNTRTDRVFEANPHLLEYASGQGHLVPCDKDGNKLMEEPESDDTLKAEVKRLEQEIYDLKTELELYRQRDNQMTEAQGPPDGAVEGNGEAQEPTEANRTESLVQAIGMLEKDNPDHFTTTGLPRVEVLEAFAGIPEVSSKERDEAWARFQG